MAFGKEKADQLADHIHKASEEQGGNPETNKAIHKLVSEATATTRAAHKPKPNESQENKAQKAVLDEINSKVNKSDKTHVEGYGTNGDKTYLLLRDTNEGKVNPDPEKRKPSYLYVEFDATGTASIQDNVSVDSKGNIKTPPPQGGGQPEGGDRGGRRGGLPAGAKLDTVSDGNPSGKRTSQPISPWLRLDNPAKTKQTDAKVDSGSASEHPELRALNEQKQHLLDQAASQKQIAEHYEKYQKAADANDTAGKEAAAKQIRTRDPRVTNEQLESDYANKKIPDRIKAAQEREHQLRQAADQVDQEIKKIAPEGKSAASSAEKKPAAVDPAKQSEIEALQTEHQKLVEQQRALRTRAQCLSDFQRAHDAHSETQMDAAIEKIRKAAPAALNGMDNKELKEQLKANAAKGPTGKSVIEQDVERDLKAAEALEHKIFHAKQEIEQRTRTEAKPAHSAESAGPAKQSEIEALQTDHQRLVEQQRALRTRAQCLSDFQRAHDAHSETQMDAATEKIRKAAPAALGGMDNKELKEQLKANAAKGPSGKSVIEQDVERDLKAADELEHKIFQTKQEIDQKTKAAASELQKMEEAKAQHLSKEAALRRNAAEYQEYLDAHTSGNKGRIQAAGKALYESSSFKKTGTMSETEYVEFLEKETSAAKAKNREGFVQNALKENLSQADAEKAQAEKIDTEIKAKQAHAASQGPADVRPEDSAKTSPGDGKPDASGAKPGAAGSEESAPSGDKTPAVGSPEAPVAATEAPATASKIPTFRAAYNFLKPSNLAPNFYKTGFNTGMTAIFGPIGAWQGIEQTSQAYKLYTEGHYGWGTLTAASGVTNFGVGTAATLSLIPRLTAPMSGFVGRVAPWAMIASGTLETTQNLYDMYQNGINRDGHQVWGTVEGTSTLGTGIGVAATGHLELAIPMAAYGITRMAMSASGGDKLVTGLMDSSMNKEVNADYAKQSGERLAALDLSGDKIVGKSYDDLKGKVTAKEVSQVILGLQEKGDADSIRQANELRLVRNQLSADEAAARAQQP